MDLNTQVINPCLRIQVERKDRLSDKLLLHQVLKDRDRPRDGLILVRHAQDTVELRQHKLRAGLLHCFCERLVFDQQRTNLYIAEA